MFAGIYWLNDLLTFATSEGFARISTTICIQIIRDILYFTSYLF